MPPKGRTTKAGDERRQRIAAMWTAGASLNEIASAIGTTSNTVGGTLARMRAAGYELPYRRAAYAAVSSGSWEDRRERMAENRLKAGLIECEAVIARGLVAAGQALRRIRDGRLYRESYSTFEDYCKERWQIEAASVAEVLDPIGSIPSEAVARELAPLRGDPEKMAEAWRDIELKAELDIQLIKEALWRAPLRRLA